MSEKIVEIKIKQSTYDKLMKRKYFLNESVDDIINRILFVGGRPL